ncbi:MAG: glycosyltransferase family 39 protein [Elusimicrobia bacterium]|nr:glycosyltransferase family 39 protein [Elusimicrobiota bacterium]
MGERGGGPLPPRPWPRSGWSPAAQAVAVIAALVAFHALNNWVILGSSEHVLDFHAASYFFKIKTLLDRLASGSWLSGLRLWATTRQSHPPLYMVSAAPLVAWHGGFSAAIMVNMAYLAVLLAAVYGAASRWYGHGTGLLAAFLVSMFPTVFALSRVFTFDFALTALVALTVWLIAAARFDSLRWCAALGVVVGAGLLAKQTYAVYLAAAALWVLLDPENRRAPRRLAHAAFSLAVGLALAAPWYAPKAGSVLSKAVYDYFESARNEGEPFFYVKSLFFRQLGPAHFIAALAAMAWSLKERQRALAWGVIAFLAFWSLASNRVDRLILAVVPFIGIMTAAGVMACSRRAGSWLAAVFVGLSLAQFAAVSYGTGRQPELPGEERGFEGVGRWSPRRFDPECGLYAKVRHSRDWRSLAARAAELAGAGRPEGTVRVLSMTDGWTSLGSELWSRLLEAGVRAEVRSILPGTDLTEEALSRWLRTADLVVVEHQPARLPIIRTAREAFEKERLAGSYGLAGSFSLQEDYGFSVYRNLHPIRPERGAPDQGSADAFLARPSSQ